MFDKMVFYPSQTSNYETWLEYFLIFFQNFFFKSDKLQQIRFSWLDNIQVSTFVENEQKMAKVLTN